MVNKNWTFISGKYVNTEAKIIRDLLDGYDRRAFPLNHTSNPLDVSVEYYVNQIQSLVIHSLNCLNIWCISRLFTVVSWSVPTIS